MYNIIPISYCYQNIITTEVPKYQKLVFDKFNLPLTQINGHFTHGEFMDYQISISNDNDILIFFDIDCIPLKKTIYDYIINKISLEGIIGIEQCAGIANESPTHIYAGPACFGISVKTYKQLHCPSFLPNKRSDVAQELTHICEENHIPVYFFKHIKSENYKWKLGIDRMFGNGSYYDDLLYHQFEIKRDGDNNININKFISKCKEVLDL